MPRMNERPPLQRVAYTMAEVAEMLGRHRSTVWRWVNDDVLKSVPVPGGRRLIQAASVERLVRGEARRK